MTLGRRDRAPSTVRRDSPEGWDVVEIEELPAQRVHARGPARPRLGALLAASAAIALLAGGIGLLGGRAASGPSTGSAAKPSHSPTATTTATAEVVQPLVTPSVPCPDTDETVVPGILLQVGDVRTPATIDVINWHGRPGASGAPDVPAAPSTTGRIEIRSDLPAVLETTGEACAVGWEITLSTPKASAVLETMGIPAVNPDMARQNRFELPLWQYRGNDYDLQAVLVYPHVVLHARWPIRILAFQPPTPTLTSGDRSIPVSPGCDVLLTFGSGGGEPLYPCDFSVVGAPPETRLAAGAPLTLTFSDGWLTGVGAVVCGQLSGTRFDEAAEGCGLPSLSGDPAAPFHAPSQPGTWTLGISACATQELDDGLNAVCGTWYATVKVRS